MVETDNSIYESGELPAGSYFIRLYADTYGTSWTHHSGDATGEYSLSLSTSSGEEAQTTVVDFNDYVDDADGDALSIATMPPSPTETLNTMFGGTLEPTGELQYEYTPPTGDYPSDFILF